MLRAVYVFSLILLGSCTCNDGAALGAVYAATSGPRWANNANWRPDGAGYCTYYGVQCTGTCVTLLSLQENNLRGTIPTQIGLLTSLLQLYLYNNQLNGTIPSHLGLLTRMTVLYLHVNDFTGTIPSEIGLLTALQILFTNANRLSGTIPSQIGVLTALSQLFLHFNQLSGTIPTQLGRLTALVQFYASGNALCGTIPTSLLPLSSIIRLGHNCLTINSDTCRVIWNLDLGSQASCSCVPCPTVTVNTSCPGFCSSPVPTAAPAPVRANPAPFRINPVPVPTNPVPVFTPASPPDSIVIEGREVVVLGDVGYSVLSGPSIVMGGAGLVTLNEMCSTVPGRSNRVVMPFPLTIRNSCSYNLFLHSGVVVLAGVASWVLLPASGICWTVFQTAFFGIVLNVGQVVSGGLGAFEAAGLAAGVLSVTVYGAVLYRLVRQWRSRVVCIEVNDTVWVSWIWRGVRQESYPQFVTNAPGSDFDQGDWEVYDNESDSVESYSTEEQNERVAVATTWFFVSRIWYFTIVRFVTCIALPSMYILLSKSWCRSISLVYLVSVLGWVLFVLWKRPLCSIVSLGLEILNSSSIATGLLPSIFNLVVTPFAILSTVLALGHFAGSIGWALQFRRMYRNLPSPPSSSLGEDDWWQYDDVTSDSDESVSEDEDDEETEEAEDERY